VKILQNKDTVFQMICPHPLELLWLNDLKWEDWIWWSMAALVHSFCPRKLPKWALEFQRAFLTESCFNNMASKCSENNFLFTHVILEKSRWMPSAWKLIKKEIPWTQLKETKIFFEFIWGAILKRHKLNFWCV